MAIQQKFIQKKDVSFYEFSILQDNILISCAQLYIKYNPNKDRFYGSIENVKTNPGFQGKGYASQLLEKIVLFGKEKNLYKITLNCKSILESFYGKHGFTQQDIFMRYNISM